MRQVSTIDDIKSLGTIMGIWAHPDDETYSMGGIMAAARQNGQQVICITATKGELGVQDEERWPPEHLASIRAGELAEAFRILGVETHHWLDYPDGGCKDADEKEAVALIADLISQYRPDTLMSFGPDGMTGHEDHITVSHWTRAARERAGSGAAVFHAIQTQRQYDASVEADKALDIYFNIDKPLTCDESQCDICFALPDDLFELKMSALRAMPSQTEAMLGLFGGSMRLSVGTEAFVRA